MVWWWHFRTAYQSHIDTCSPWTAWPLKTGYQRFATPQKNEGLNALATWNVANQKCLLNLLYNEKTQNQPWEHNYSFLTVATWSLFHTEYPPFTVFLSILSSNILPFLGASKKFRKSDSQPRYVSISLIWLHGAIQLPLHKNSVKFYIGGFH